MPTRRRPQPQGSLQAQDAQASGMSGSSKYSCCPQIAFGSLKPDQHPACPNYQSTKAPGPSVGKGTLYLGVSVDSQAETYGCWAASGATCSASRRFFGNHTNIRNAALGCDLPPSHSEAAAAQVKPHHRISSSCPTLEQDFFKGPWLC